MNKQNKQTKLQEEKRAAFKRFSKMGAAGLAVLSMSAFTNLSAQQGIPKVEPDSCRDAINRTAAIQGDTLIKIEPDTTPRYGDSYGNPYSNYTNNYSNGYSNAGYSNHYSNYCDANN